MKGEIRETEWIRPSYYDGMVKTFYRISPRFEDGALPYHEVYAKVTGGEMRSLSKEALQSLQGERASEARRKLEEILEKE